MMTLETYRQDAINRAKNKIASRILNDSINHANILIETMVGMAGPDDVVKIYSGTLPANSFFEALKNTGAKEILVVLDDDTKLQWIAELPASQLAKIEVRKIAKQRPNHFFCVSSGAFRYETDATTYRAEANFNEPVTAEILSKAFDGYWLDATKVLLDGALSAQNGA